MAAWNWTALSSFGEHVCGIRFNDSTTWCWGNNVYGTLGTGTYNSIDGSKPLAVVAGTRKWAALSAGGAHTCALATDSTAWCWGKIGCLNPLSAQGCSNVPAAVAGGATIKYSAISSGQSHTCALYTADSTAACWGSDDNGQLGRGMAIAGGATAPAPVADNQVWSSISCGSQHTCALRKNDSTAWCWGRGIWGQLGNNATATSRRPVAVSRIAGDANATAWSSIHAGYDHTCARRKSDSLTFCWGFNGFGQITDKAAATVVLTPMAIAGGVKWTALSAGRGHTVGIKV